MSHPKEPYDRLFDRFNPCFAKVADEEKLVFQFRAGPNIGRALRLKDDPLDRGVFLELKRHWSKSDPVDPLVTLGYGAWFCPTRPFPLHILTKVFYEGSLSGLEERATEAMLKIAASEVKLVSQEQVMREGKLFTDWPKEGEDAGSYYQ